MSLRFEPALFAGNPPPPHPVIKYSIIVYIIKKKKKNRLPLFSAFTIYKENEIENFLCTEIVWSRCIRNTSAWPCL